MSQEYVAAQKASGLKIGDKVIIVNTAKEYENGWGVGWISSMDKEVGNIGTVMDVYEPVSDQGVPVKTSTGKWLYPFFVLEKLPNDHDEYKIGLEKCPLKVGETVKILKKFEKGEYGYNATWVSNMEDAIGKTGKITSKNNAGYTVDIAAGSNVYTYPYFTLQPIEVAGVPAPSKKATPQEYMAGHKASGLKAGDIVKVLKTANDYEGGWSVGWSGEMTKNIGKELEIEKDYGGSGFHLDDGYNYPYFVLEKVSSGESKAAKFQQSMIDSDYKTGDIVKLTGKADHGEQGWKGHWNYEIDLMIGKFGVISGSTSSGFLVYFEKGDNYYLPPFILEKATKEDINISPHVLFVSEMLAAPFKVGDVVTVTRKAEDYENGWGTSWNSDMDSFIGSDHLITDSNMTRGYELDDSGWFPYFILKLVPAVTPEEYMKGFEIGEWAVGDIVKVIRRIPKGVAGSTIGWDSNMINSVGKKYQITDIRALRGWITLDNGRVYPYNALEKTTGPTFKQEKDQFRKDMAESPIKDGDTVKITRAAESKEHGWGLNWTPSMNKLIGNEYVVKDKNAEYGFEIIIKDSSDEYGEEGRTFVPVFIVERTKIGTSREEYRVLFQNEMKKSPIKIGDSVKIVYKPTKEREKGWRGDWTLSDTVIKKFNQFEVLHKDINYGFRIQDDDDEQYYVPYYSIEKIETPIVSPKKMFIKAMEESPIKIKSVVKVLRKAKNYEKGWQDTWYDPMDAMVGKYYRVVGKNNKAGFILINWANDDAWHFPFFVLELSLKNKRLPLSPKGKFAKEVRVSPFKKNTVAKVVKKIDSYPGWANTWDDNADNMIGQEYLVIGKHPSYGIRLYDDEEEEEGERWFPPAALQLVAGVTKPHRVPFNPFEGQPMFMDEAKWKRIPRRLKKFIEDEEEFVIQEAILDAEVNKLEEVDVQHTFGFPVPDHAYWSTPKDATKPEDATVEIPYYKSDILTWDKIGEADRDAWFEEISKELSEIAEDNTSTPDDSYYEDYIESYLENTKQVIKEIISDKDFQDRFFEVYNFHLGDSVNPGDAVNLVIKFLENHKQIIEEADIGISINGSESMYDKIVIAQFDDDNYGEGIDPISLPEELMIKLQSIPEGEDDNLDIDTPTGVYSVHPSDDMDSLIINYKSPTVTIYMTVDTALALLSDNGFSLEGFTPPTEEPDKFKTVGHQAVQHGPPEEIDPDFDPFEGEPMFGKE